jgi:lipoprotein-anchoring transpeptidase ErfK/SrfK
MNASSSPRRAGVRTPHAGRRGLLRTLAVVALGALAVGALVGPAGATAHRAPHRRPTSSSVAHVIASQIAIYGEPGAAEPVLTLTNPTATGGRLVFLVADARADGWVKVLLPIRPNGSTGWVHAADIAFMSTPYRVIVKLSAHRLQLTKKGKRVLDVPAGIGKGNTPTPGGSYYITQLFQPPDSSGPYGPYAYSLSGYSDVLQTFQGGDAIIGIHGTNHPELVGSDVSHGCIRVTNDVITRLAKLLPLGTPVEIRP